MSQQSQDVLHDMFGYIPAQTQCDYCNKVIPLKDAIITTVSIGSDVVDKEHHCSKQCAHNAWVQRAGVDV